QLPQVCRAAVNITTHKVSVAALEISAIHRMAGKNQITKSGCKTFDLRFDSFGHIERGITWHMAVGPRDVLSGGCAGSIEQAWLGEQNERSLGRLVLGDCAL